MLCILFMTTTHAWPGAIRTLAADVPDAFHIFYVIIIDSFGRASVPLLSIISGMLVFHSLSNSNATKVVKGKFKTLIIPMIAWSLPIIAIIFLEPLVRNTQTPDTSLMAWLNYLFSVTEAPANGPLHFFRDIFIMALYSIAIFWVFQRNRYLGTILAIVILLLEQKSGGFLIFRNQIAFMYIVGFLISAWGHSNWQPSQYLAAACALFYALYEIYGPSNTEALSIYAQRFWELAPRGAMAMVMWAISAYLVKVDWANSRIQNLEPHIFVVFCTHMIVVKFIALVAWLTDWSEMSLFHPVVLIGQVALFVIVGVLVDRLLTPFPWLRGKKNRPGYSAVAAQPTPVASVK